MLYFAVKAHLALPAERPEGDVQISHKLLGQALWAWMQTRIERRVGSLHLLLRLT